MAYIPALDGLRAVAVVLVLLFHAEIPPFSGGFIGVDVFFCISGFIITRLIARDIAAGDFSFGAFYARRVARLLPALIFAIVATLAAAWFVLVPSDLAALGQSALFCLTWVSNVFFWFESTDYFADGAATNLLLHTWSLGVEEQFYLLWPSLLMGLFALPSGRWRAALLVALSAGTFALARLQEPQDPGAVFYMTPFRLFEFGIGALVAIKSIRIGGWPAELGCVVGLCVLIGLAVHLHAENATITTYGLAPSLASALVIASLDGRSARWILANPVSVFLGRRSYAVYLVHWPMIGLWNLSTDFQLSVAEGVALSLASIAAGAALHASIERRFRFKPDSTPRFRSGVVIGTVASNGAALLLAGALWAGGGFRGRLPDHLEQEFAKVDAQVVQIRNERARLVQAGRCFLSFQHRFSDFSPEECLKTKKGAKGRFLIIGDSYATDMIFLLKRTFPRHSFSQITAAWCPAFAPELLSKRYETCSRLNEFRFRYVIEESDFDAVIVAGSWRRADLEELRESLRALKRSKSDIVLVGPRARFAASVPRILKKHGGIDAVNEVLGDYLLGYLPELNAELASWDGPHDHYVDILAAQCEPRCDGVKKNGDLLYADTGHLSWNGAKVLGRRLKKEFAEIFRRAMAD